MEQTYRAKTWEPIDFTIYFSFIRWWVLLAIVAELVFRWWAGGLVGSIFAEQTELFAWAIRLMFLGLLGWRVVMNFGYSTPIALVTGACSGFIVGLAVSISRLFFGWALWKIPNIITETVIVAMVGVLFLFLVVYVFNIKNN